MGKNSPSTLLKSGAPWVTAQWGGKRELDGNVGGSKLSSAPAAVPRSHLSGNTGSKEPGDCAWEGGSERETCERRVCAKGCEFMSCGCVCGGGGAARGG